MTNLDDKAQDFVTLFAFRTVGADGWEIGKATASLDQIQADLVANGQHIEDIRQIRSGISLNPEGGDEAGLWDLDYWLAIERGWAFDYVANCWRAPGEMPQQFERDAASIDDLKIAFGTPEAGALPINISAGGDTLKFAAVDVNCPFEDFLTWLEHIADGKAARFTANLKWAYVEFFAFNTPVDETTHIAIALSKDPTRAGARNIVLDFEIARRTAVAVLYHGLRQYAQGPVYDPYQWSAVPLAEAFADKFPNRVYADFINDTAAAINKTLWDLTPVYSLTSSRKASTGLIGSGEGDGEQMMRFDNPLCEVPDDFDAWDVVLRQACLDDLLTESVTGGWGEDLRDLRASKLEIYLGDVSGAP